MRRYPQYLVTCVTRVTPQLKTALENDAKNLRRTPSDIIREMLEKRYLQNQSLGEHSK